MQLRLHTSTGLKADACSWSRTWAWAACRMRVAACTRGTWPKEGRRPSLEARTVTCVLVFSAGLSGVACSTSAANLKGLATACHPHKKSSAAGPDNKCSGAHTVTCVLVFSAGLSGVACSTSAANLNGLATACHTHKRSSAAGPDNNYLGLIQ